MSKSPFNGIIQDGGPFPPEAGRYHLYIGMLHPALLPQSTLLTN